MSKGGNTHELKTVQPYFDAVASGEKPFEVRRDDRGFAVDDLLLLREWRDGSYTGRQCLRRVTFVLRGFEGLKDEYVALGLGKP